MYADCRGLPLTAASADAVAALKVCAVLKERAAARPAQRFYRDRLAALDA